MVFLGYIGVFLSFCLSFVFCIYYIYNLPPLISDRVLFAPRVFLIACIYICTGTI